MKLYVVPKPNENSGGGVFAVMEAHKKHLRARGVEYVDSEKKADLVIHHALAHTSRPPDVFHSHGFYPTVQAGWDKMFDDANDMLINSMMTARAVVSVSELAAEVMRRDFHITPQIIRNGVNFKELHMGGNSRGPIIWPKMSTNPTCDPAPLRTLATKRGDLQFISLPNVAQNVRAYGRQPHKEFLALLRTCSIYLGTTRENNSMGMMEAMGMGIPVVGYDWGFSREWLHNGRGCELVEPGDIDGLSRALTRVLLDWKAYHSDAADFARAKFGWEQPMEQIHDLYMSLMDPTPAQSVSIVITLYNYGRWIGEAVKSAKDQDIAEVIVVDDASTDNPVIPPGVKVIRFDKNQGVATARNVGIAQAKGNLIICLDADDKLAPYAVRRLMPKFSNPRLGIAFAPLSLTDEAGRMNGKRWFEAPFNFDNQRNGRNSVPCCAMFRREAWERAGGFRSYEKPCEDAAFWLRVASQGWHVDNIGGECMLYYRMHGAVDERAGSETQLNPVFDWHSGRAWAHRNSGVGELVQIYDCPRVSFVIEYRLKHEKDFIRTLDSIENLRAVDWEVCATGVPSMLVKSGWPWVRWNEHPSGPVEVYIESGEIIDEKAWSQIIENAEFPK
jgi:glycosyltransferase involved in cell wall biosynthesis